MKISLKRKKLKSGKLSLYLEHYKGSFISLEGVKKHNRDFEKKGKGILFFSLVLLFNVSHAQRIVNCEDDNCLEAALLNALPGDEIVLKAGITFKGGSRSSADNYSAFWSNKSGTVAKPIILRGENATNKPTISSDRGTHSWYGINLSGSYWEIKNIKVKDVLKGVVLDGANHCKLINLDVFDIGQEAIHLRTGSSNNLIKGCLIKETGRRSANDLAFGEGVYVGSNRTSHDKFDPNCNNNIIENCTFGPGISAEALDIKEGTERTIVRSNTFFAEGISGANSGDSFIDLKGIYGYVYGNTFNVLRDADAMNSVIDISNRTFGSYSYKTGSHSAIFENTINLSADKINIPTARIILDPEKQPNPSENVHAWDNTRNPANGEVIDPLSQQIVKDFCPVWNEFRVCTVLNTSNTELQEDFTMYPNPALNILYFKGKNVLEVKEVYINSLQGKVLYRSSHNYLNTGLDVSTLSSGIYIISFVTKSDVTSKNFIKK